MVTVSRATECQCVADRCGKGYVCSVHLSRPPLTPGIKPSAVSPGPDAHACMHGLLSCPAVEVILAAPGKVPKEEKLYVQKATFGKVWTTVLQLRPCGVAAIPG